MQESTAPRYEAPSVEEIGPDGSPIVTTPGLSA